MKETVPQSRPSDEAPGKQYNIIKTRDDISPVKFYCKKSGANEGKGKEYVLASDKDHCSWVSSPNSFFEDKLRERIEPWLTALFQSEHLSLLVGTGLTTGICNIADVKATGMKFPTFSIFKSEIEYGAKQSASRLERGEPNFEDAIRTANIILSYKEITNPSQAEQLRKEIDNILTRFAKSILETERNLATSKKKSDSFNYLISFLLSFASRTGTRDRVNFFTLNYDRLIEEAADLAGLHLLDRFIGKISPVFRASRLNLDLHYNPPGIRGEPRYLEGVARLTKLHGSLDWVQTGPLIRRIGLPFGAKVITPHLKAMGLPSSSGSSLMIYPNSAKDKETTAYPYVELFRDFAAAICRPNSTVVTYGYGFGDDHINRVLRDMLTIPSTHLVIISFDDANRRVLNFYEATAHKDQISLLIGPDIASIDNLTTKFLPKSAIDYTTSKMGELLKNRLVFYSEDGQKDEKTAEDPKKPMPKE